MPPLEAQGWGHIVPNEATLRMLEAVADRAADKAATSAVSETFSRLGLDLNDQETVQATRAMFIDNAGRAQARKQRNEALRKGVISTLVTMTGTFILTMWTTMRHGAN